ncbi:hypothetical protein AMQ83_11590, partial [Paenibacillus riograndensis]
PWVGAGKLWVQSLPFSRVADGILSAAGNSALREHGSILGGLGNLLDGRLSLATSAASGSVIGLFCVTPTTDCYGGTNDYEQFRLRPVIRRPVGFRR